MKVQLFQQVPYRHLPADFEQRYDSVVDTPYYDLVQPEKAHEAYKWSIDELLHAARSGFDGVAVTEHGQSSYDMAPNPDLIAAVLAHTMQAEGRDAAINVLGRSLGKSKEPLRVAEEYAMLDCISGGRLIAGIPVGLSYDANLNNGVPPIETRARYNEARELMIKAWTAREPFTWNGKYSQYRSVNIWPRPVQEPHPPIWMPAVGNPQTMAMALDNDIVYVYLSWFGPKVTGKRIFDRYWEIAEEKEEEPNPYRIAFLQVTAVAETDERAEREYAPHIEYFFNKGLGSIPPQGLGLPGYIAPPGVEALLRDPSDFGIFYKMREATFKDLVENQNAIVGSPATVRDQIAEFVKEFRIGNLLVMLQIGSMPHDLTLKNISLFAEEVMPHLRDIWDDEGWAYDHYWPKGSAGRVPSGEGTEA